MIKYVADYTMHVRGLYVCERVRGVFVCVCVCVCVCV